MKAGENNKINQVVVVDDDNDDDDDVSVFVFLEDGQRGKHIYCSRISVWNQNNFKKLTVETLNLLSGNLACHSFVLAT